MRIIDFITATDFLNPKLVITQEFDHKNIISGKVTVKDANTILISPSPELVTLSELLSILKKYPKFHLVQQDLTLLLLRLKSESGVYAIVHK